MDSLIRESIFWLQLHSSAEALTVWLFLLCAAAILALFRFYGVIGLYVYNALAIIFANIQVLRFTQFASFSEPVALGTVLFTTTFLVNDIISEHYGSDYAKKSVVVGFWSQILITLWMIITLAHPLPSAQASATISEAHVNYTSMLQIFTPSLRILLASLISYVCSQWLDIVIFNRLRAMTNGKFLWLRQNVAMLLSGLFDTFLFSFLAWMLLSETPISWQELVVTYVLSAQVMRMLLNFAFTPLMYMSYYCVPSKAKFQVLDLKKRPA